MMQKAGATRVVIVPGLAVRSYVLPPARALHRAGYDVSLLRAPTWRGTPAHLRRYGEILAHDLDQRGQPVDLLVGLSVGTQAAAVAAARTSLVRSLLLVSPTVDPANRTLMKLLGAWLFGDSWGDDPNFRSSLPDWLQAGLPRILTGFVSSLTYGLEDVLPAVAAETTIVHPEHDYLGSTQWTRMLADVSGARVVFKPGKAHSWPVDDPTGFVELVNELVGDPR